MLTSGDPIRRSSIDFFSICIVIHLLKCFLFLARLLNDVRQNQLRDPRIALISSGQSLLDVRLDDQLVAISYLPKTFEERLQLIGGPEGILSQMKYFNVSEI